MGLKPRPLVIGSSMVLGGTLFLGVSFAAKSGTGGKIILTVIGTIVGAGVGLILIAD